MFPNVDHIGRATLALLGYASFLIMALIALSIRIRRHSKPLGTIIMFLLDVGLGLFVIGDLVYLYLTGRALKDNATHRGTSAAVHPANTKDGIVIVQRHTQQY